MRIAVSNPDNIGDFVLRQPMLSAFLDAGHTLLLVVRDFVAPLAMDLFPDAVVLACPGNPYDRDFTLQTPTGLEFLRQVRAFEPMVLTVASYQHTVLEESLAEALPEADCVGFNGHLYQARPEVTEIVKIRFAARALVAAETKELTKNELLCAAVLGRDVVLPAPQMEASAEGLTEARLQLDRLGLGRGPFWVVCAGDIADKSIKNWTLEQWARFCAALLEQETVQLLFTGSPDEHAATEAIRAGMGDAGLLTATITDEPTTLQALIGILQLAEGYIGKDTGPMHISAALGKPVVALFGGGHWPRFVPAAKLGAAFTVAVPCVGCNWSCQLQRSHCVKDVPTAAVLRAVAAAIRGELATFSVEVLTPAPELEAAMVRELWERAQRKNQLLEAERTNFLHWHEDRLRDIANLRGELEQGRERMQSAEALLRTWNELEGAVLPESGETFWPLRERLAQLTGLAAEARAMEEQVASASFQERLAVAQREATDAALRRTERLRQSALRKFLAVRVEAQQLREENEQLRASSAEVGALHDELALWQAKWRSTADELEQVREALDRTKEAMHDIQARADATGLQDHHRLMDQEIVLKRREEELRSALGLIPELRDELALERERLQGEIATINADRETRLADIQTLTAQLAESEEDRAARLRAIHELQATLATVEEDRTARLRIIHELQATLATVEDDREARLRMIHDLRSMLATVEEDREARGGQIVTLHEIIANLQREISDLHNLLPYRILRKFR